MLSHSFDLALVALAALSIAAPAPERDLLVRAVNAYAPISAACPATPLVRPATSLNTNEAAYISSRKTKAGSSLATWLDKQGPFSISAPPVVGFTSSGGGLRSLLTTAGIVQAFDARDSVLSTSGVYQGLTYQAGLSGGAWFLSSLAGNNWPTVSSLQSGLWDAAFATSFLVPASLLTTGLTEYEDVVADVTAKQAAGFQTTAVDPYGRLLSYQLLYGADGGVADRLSGLTSLSNFTSYNVPFPIITTTYDEANNAECLPLLKSPIFEFTPYEYGAWDTGVSAFAQTAYAGTSISNGVSTTGKCVINYDNLGYVLGTSSNLFNEVCGIITADLNSTDITEVLEAIVALTHPPVYNDQFGIYPNPFYAYPRSTLVSTSPYLTLSDGGETDQNNPIWPFIQPERNVGVLIVNDNSADTSNNFPNGSEIYQTYTNAQAAGLTKMPTIPPASTFVSEGLNKRATFFGCNQTGTVLIVYLPNVNYTYASNQATAKLEYTPAETAAMIANGNAIATQDGAAGWPFCLACAIASGQSGLPAGCNACFQKYCYHS